MSPNPVAVTSVTRDSSGSCRYAAAYLAPGDYTLALTGQSRDDFPLVDNSITFVESRNWTLAQGQDASVDF